MTKKRPAPLGPTEPSEADDLQLIDGIGPAVENRLHRVGIFSFAQLATLSPADIAAAVADLSGLSAERIIKQDWIGQARKLVEGSALAKRQKNTNTATSAKPRQITSKHHSSVDGLAGLLKLSKPQTVLGDTRVPQNMLRFDQPYEVHCTLHLANAVTSLTSVLNYTTSAYAWTIDQWQRLPIGVVHGNIKQNEAIDVTIKGVSLLPGVYWLEAEALVTLPALTQGTPSSRELLATIKGHLFEIY